MFKDSRELDRQRTAGGFDTALQHYAERSESWFDGTVDSVDRRLASCDKLLHAARATLARFSPAESGRYLSAQHHLQADHQALAALREDLLTGAASRADVVGPPGWRFATDLNPSALESVPATPAVSDPMDSPDQHLGNWRQAADPTRGTDPNSTLNHYFPGAGSDVQFGIAQQESMPHEYGTTPLDNAMSNTPTTGVDAFRSGGRHDVDRWEFPHQKPAPYTEDTGKHEAQERTSSLSGSDRRWVELEAAKFIAAHPDALTDSHELATRAHHHAAVKTSTFTQQRSAAICQAFVAKVGALGARSYRPRTASAPPPMDLSFPAECMYL